MQFETDKVRGAETTPNHVVLKMLLASIGLTVAAFAIVALVN